MKVGVVLPDLGNCQQVFMAINYINTMIFNKIFTDFTLFYCRNVAVVTKPLCATICVDKVFQFDGLLVATDLYTLSLIKNVKSKKVLYLWDLEWIRGNGDYFGNNELLNDPNLILVCRTTFHSTAIKNYCGRDAKIIANFNLKLILEECGVI